MQLLEDITKKIIAEQDGNPFSSPRGDYRNGDERADCDTTPDGYDFEWREDAA